MCLEVREAATAPAAGQVLNPVAAAVGTPALATAGGGTTSSKTPSHFPQWDDEIDPDASTEVARDMVTTFLFAIVCVSMVAVLGVLIWQVISLLRMLFGL
jgi:hypothetical protein